MKTTLLCRVCGRPTGLGWRRTICDRCDKAQRRDGLTAAVVLVWVFGSLLTVAEHCK